MNRIVIVLLALMGVSSLAQERFFEKYSYTKAMTSCFGDEVYYAYYAQLVNYGRECQQLPVFLKGMPNTINFPVYPTQQPGYYADVGGQTGYVPVQSYYPNQYPSVLYGVPHRHRTGRQIQQQPTFNGDDLRGSLDKVQAALSNFTCTLRKAELIDDNLNLRVDTAINNYNNFPIDNTLRQDLVNSLNYCKELVSCLPLQRLNSPVPESLQRLVMFTKCEKKTRLGVCFKHDIRKNINQFDVSALPNIGGNAGDVEKLMTILIGADSTDELELY